MRWSRTAPGRGRSVPDWCSRSIRMTPGRRAVVGFAISPIASGIVHAVHVGDWRAGVVALCVAYPAAVVLGAPVALYFSKSGRRRLWQAALGGTCTGFAAAVILLGLIGLVNARMVSGSLASYFLALLSIHGLLVACLYWTFTIGLAALSDRPGSRRPG